MPSPADRSAVPARFVARPNRFVVVARLEDGTEVRAYLPNTGRLTHLTTPGRRLILRRDGGPPRVTEYTVTRAWDGCWVALEASRAPTLLAEWLHAGSPLGPFGPVRDLRAEIGVEGHRLDLLAETGDGPVWIEVKSGGRVTGSTALLSKTPSARGVAHLAALSRLVAAGHRAAVAFVIQRPDARELLVGGDADAGWVEAVRAAGSRGVAVLGFACAVDEVHAHVARALPVRWDPSRRSPLSPHGDRPDH